MISYDLAKQLKDAGFPQVADRKGTLRKDGSYLFPDGITLATSQKKMTKVIAYAPNLEELIDALPEQHCNLTRYKNNQWVAANGWHETYENAPGDTAIEAVAKLWLSLNASSAAPSSSAER